jgi:hypothetical protein
MRKHMPIGAIETGLGTRGVWEISRIALHRALGWRYKQVFGGEAGKGGMHVVYGLLNPPQAADQTGAPVQHIFTKPGVDGARFSASEAVSACEVRAATYVAESIASNTGMWVRLSSDEALRPQLDLSYISLGIGNNCKTMDVLNSVGNQFVRFNAGTARFVTVSGRTIIEPSSDPQTDYGMILKSHPPNLPERNWIVCGGYGEWGTSGAAWYLSRKWRDIRKLFGKKPFVIFVQVKRDKDESAIPIIQTDSPQELEMQARGT